MISLAQPLPIGNAVRLLLEPPAGAVAWRVLRRGSNTFTGPVDTGAFLVFEGTLDSFVDTQFIENGVPYFYKPYYSFDHGATWTPGGAVSATPRASYADLSTDVMTLLRDRLEAGLKIEVERGAVVSDLGYVQVFTAPPIAETTSFPAVTIHLESEKPAERAIGEYIGGDEFDVTSYGWEETDGWLADVTLQIIGWCLNADERSALRKALRRIIIGNLGVFAAEGLDLVVLEQSDVDSLNGEYGVPGMFQTVNTFTCLAPVRVGGNVDAISSVISRSING